MRASDMQCVCAILDTICTKMIYSKGNPDENIIIAEPIDVTSVMKDM